MQLTNRNLQSSHSNTNRNKATTQTVTAVLYRAVNNRICINKNAHIKLILSTKNRYNKSNYTIHSKTEFITISTETRIKNDKAVHSIVNI